MTHTPGPWKFIDNGWFGHGNYPPVGQLSSMNNAADSRLIEAAPDMLAALKAVAKWEEDGGGGPDVFGMVADAIAKAEGKP
jgi:hypothetical protein